MVNFVLNYLRRKVGEGFDAGLKISGLPLHFYCPITLTFSGTSEQRKTAFFRIVGARFFDNFRVKHNRICAVIIKGNDAFANADHIRRHADTAVFVGNERVQQILCHL